MSGQNLLPDISLSFDAELDIDGDESKAYKHARRQQQVERYTPRFIRYSVGINVPASPGVGFQFITDSPSEGRRLEIVRFHLDVAQPIGVAVPTGITVYLLADPGNIPAFSGQNLHSASVIKRYTSLPIDDTWGNHQAVVYHPENVYVVATQSGGTAIQLSGNIQTTDMPVDEFTEPQMVYHILKTFDDDGSR